MADIPQTRTRMTLEAFLALPETSTPTEFIDGELIVSPAPKDARQAVFYAIIAWMVHQVMPGGGALRHQPTDVHFGENVLQPDIFWVGRGSTRCQLGEDGYWLVDPTARFVEVYTRESSRFRHGAFGLEHTFISLLFQQSIAVNQLFEQPP